MVNYQQPVRGGLVNLGGTKSRFQGTLGALFFLSLLLPTLAPFFFVVFFFFSWEYERRWNSQISFSQDRSPGWWDGMRCSVP